METELTTQQEDLILESVRENDFLDDEERYENGEEIDCDFQYDMMRDLKFEEEYNKMTKEEKMKLNNDSGGYKNGQLV